MNFDYKNRWFLTKIFKNKKLRKKNLNQTCSFVKLVHKSIQHAG